ncbi:MAG: hypothetical protein J1F23_07455 [Oscillospiraceae bacterium]|nr:hypothetical protein [Oscillospiraceae bacterium]
MPETKNVILDINDAEAYESIDFEDFNKALNGVYFREKSKAQLDRYKDIIDDFCNNSNGTDVNELSKQCCNVIINAVLGPFGISPALFNDRLGGNVTTQHNASQGIFSKKEEQYDGDEYCRAEYKKKVKEAKSGNGPIIDAYTGKTLEPNDVNVDHVISRHEIHKDYGYMLSKEERAAVGADSRNHAVTDQSLNKSKSDQDLDDFANKTSSDGKQTNKEKYGMKDDLMAEAKEKAQQAVEDHRPPTSRVIKYHASALAKQGAKDAGKNALRAAIGLLLSEMAGFLVDVITDTIKTYKSDKDEDFKKFLSDLKRLLKERMGQFKEKNLNADKFKEIMKTLGASAGAGFLSTLFTYVVNCFFTTAAKVVTMIRENINSFVRAIKIMADKNVPFETRLVAASQVVFDAILATLGIVLVQSLVTQLKTIPPLSDISESLANVIVGLLTGLISVVVFYFVNKFIKRVNETNAALTAAHAGVALNTAAAGDLSIDTLSLVQNSFETRRQIDKDMADIAQMDMDNDVVTINDDEEDDWEQRLLEKIKG